MKQLWDVIVVGAGLAGLSAACALEAQGRSVRVLEARDRIGGRVFSSQVAASVGIDRGGQWVGPGQTRMYALIKELGLTLVPTPLAGRHLHRTRAGVRSTRLLLPPLGVFGYADVLQLALRMHRAAGKIPLENPWLAARAALLDSTPFDAWIGARAWTRSGGFAFLRLLSDLFCVDVGRVSALEALHQLRTIGGIFRLLGAEKHFVREGAQSVALGLAQSLREPVKLQTVVQQVRWSSSQVEVVTDDGRFLGKHVVMACPPGLLRDIEWSPALPDLPLLENDFIAGDVHKAVFTFASAFWIERGLSGFVSSEVGAPALCIDGSVPGQGSASLVLLTNGPRSLELRSLSAADRQQRLMQGLVEIFETVPSPLDYFDCHWSEERFSGGGYAGRFALGAWTRARRMPFASIGCVHFACTELATAWRSYMEGAVRAGEAAAQEILAA